MKKHILCSLITLSLLGSCNRDEEVVKETTPAKWDYENPNWQNQGYSECAGLVQSPIDIITTSTIKAHLPEVQFNYNYFPIKVIDNGHTVQVNASNNSITYNGQVYNLKQFHYHGHSEHYIDGKYMPMELHFVHQNPTTGSLIVLGVMVEGGGANNPAFEKYLKAFPTVKEKEFTLTDTINPSEMFPASKMYYNYTGSPTTPPCSQGLNWIIFKDKLQISSTQLELFTKAYGHNARPIQPTGSRTVFESQPL